MKHTILVIISISLLVSSSCANSYEDGKRFHVTEHSSIYWENPKSRADYIGFDIITVTDERMCREYVFMRQQGQQRGQDKIEKIGDYKL